MGVDVTNGAFGCLWGRDGKGIAHRSLLAAHFAPTRSGRTDTEKRRRCGRRFAGELLSPVGFPCAESEAEAEGRCIVTVRHVSIDAAERRNRMADFNPEAFEKTEDADARETGIEDVQKRLLAGLPPLQRQVFELVEPATSTMTWQRSDSESPNRLHARICAAHARPSAVSTTNYDMR